MALDFPASPTPGQQFNAAGSSWVWDGTAWNIVPQMVDAVASDTPPANPAVGQLWWRASTGVLYVYYDDGNSQQWVQAAGAASQPGLWEPIYNGNVVTTGSSFVVKDLGPFEYLRGRGIFKPSAAGSGIYAQTSNDNGLNWATAGYIVEYANFKGTTWTGLYQTAPDHFTLSGTYPVAATGLSFTMECFEWNKPAANGKVMLSWGGDDGVLYGGQLYAYVPLGARNAIRFYTGAPSMSGRFMLEGVRG